MNPLKNQPDGLNYNTNVRRGLYQPLTIKKSTHGSGKKSTHGSGDEDVVGYVQTEAIQSFRRALGSDHRRLVGDISAEVNIFYRGRRITFSKTYKANSDMYDLQGKLNDIATTVLVRVQSSLTSLNDISAYKRGEKDPYTGQKSLKPMILTQLEKECGITVKVSKCKENMKLEDLSTGEIPKIISEGDLLVQWIKDKVGGIKDRKGRKRHQREMKEELLKLMEGEQNIRESEEKRGLCQDQETPKPLVKKDKVKRLYDEKGYRLIKD